MVENYFKKKLNRCHGGGAGNSQGRGAGNSLGERSDLIKARNASDIARMHAAEGSAVKLAEDPDYYLLEHTHDADENHND